MFICGKDFFPQIDQIDAEKKENVSHEGAKTQVKNLPQRTRRERRKNYNNISRRDKRAKPLRNSPCVLGETIAHIALKHVPRRREGAKKKTKKPKGLKMATLCS